MMVNIGELAHIAYAVMTSLPVSMTSLNGLELTLV